MRPKIFGAAIFAVFLSLMCFVRPAGAYYTNMSAAVVIGQPNLTSNSVNQGAGAVGSANTFNGPFEAVMVGTKLVVSDEFNHRVLIYNQVPTSNNVSADVVIGQQNFSGTTANQGGSVNANTINVPAGVSTDGTRLFIADVSNHRVLIFNRLPTSNNASADVVIGQINMTTATSNTTVSTLKSPNTVFYDSESGKLFISDTGNNRILIYNQIPTTNGVSADIVLGQLDFISGAVNQGLGVANATTLSNPQGMSVKNGKLFVTDFGNNRALIWNSVPMANATPADVVIGQTNFSNRTANQGGGATAGPNTLSGPAGTSLIIGNRLFIVDFNNRRVLIWNNIPNQNNASADVVIGQANFSGSSANQGGSVNANTFNAPVSSISINNQQLLVTDRSNNRILIFNNDSTAPGLSISSPQSAENNLVKLTGNASTISNYWIQNVQYMVNGGGFNGATATDGSFDSANENFFFTFDPKSNSNKDDGYTVQIKSTTSNADTTDHLFYFQPFGLNTPLDRSFIIKSLPTFSFSVNKQQTQLKENISKYQVMVKRSGGDWQTYVNTIPVDYMSIKDSADNLQKSNLATDGNGTYEDKKILVVYSNNNSTLTVTPKAVDDQGNGSSLSFDQNGKLLSNGGYEWKVQAVDKNGHTQETETRKFVVGSSQFSNGSNWFPLQINSITGLGRVYLSTINPQLVKPKYRIQTSNPIFKGIATANSTVQLDLTNLTCQTKGESNCTQTFSANSNGASQFTLSTSANTLKSGSIYQAQFSVSQNGLFNALPPFQITR